MMFNQLSMSNNHHISCNRGMKYEFFVKHSMATNWAFDANSSKRNDADISWVLLRGPQACMTFKVQQTSKTVVSLNQRSCRRKPTALWESSPWWNATLQRHRKKIRWFFMPPKITTNWFFVARKALMQYRCKIFNFAL
ncbi:uncharacterized protein [Euwallacea fornicatus]|uniref:uncharacterized protein n=1 Tax=Euwallacea fornicatus TaxID=995702 RepID=UPI0033903891